MGQLQSFDHTHILYDPDNILSLFLALWSLYPIGVLIFYFSWFITTREIECVIIAGGQVVNDIINNIIKYILAFERPDINGTGYGMPSAHSQFMGFMSIYFSLKLIYQWTDICKIQKILGVSALYITTFLVMLSRYYLNYHTIYQVIVGLLFGTILGSIYFTIISIARDIGFIQWITTWKVCDWICIKDSWGRSPLSLRKQRSDWISSSTL